MQGADHLSGGNEQPAFRAEPSRQRVVQGIARVLAMQIDDLLFHDAEDCRRSIAHLNQFRAEIPGDLTSEGYGKLEAQIVQGVLAHARRHLAKLHGGTESGVHEPVIPLPACQLFEDLEALPRSVAAANAAGRHRLEALRRGFAGAFGHAPAIGERLAVLAGQRLTQGMPPDRPAGSAVLAGPYGCGKSWLVTRFAEVLSGLDNGCADRPIEVDLRDFGDGEDGLGGLVTRLAEIAASTNVTVIAFDGLGSAGPPLMSALETLVRTGSLGCGRRDVCLGGRFLFFMVDCGPGGPGPVATSRAAISRLLGKGLVEAVSEVIIVPPPSEDLITSLAVKEVEARTKDLSRIAGRGLRIDESMVRQVVKRVLERGGFGHAIGSVVEESIRRPVSELLVKGAVSASGSPIAVIHEAGQDFLVHGSRRDPLPVHPGARDPSFDLEAELSNLVGLAPVKTMIRNLSFHLTVERRRRELGVAADAAQSLHMLFLGNPGTGKTSVARIVANMLRELGALRLGHLVEADQSSLVAGYVGQTALKTRSVVQSALGGVLFIDEAYSLTRRLDGFGIEAVDTLVAEMERHRDDLVVIMAGYTAEMRQFLDSNPGLRSRFPHQFEFPDYSEAELAHIACLEVKRRGLRLSPNARRSIEGVLAGMVVAGRSDQGNGRLARSVVEAAIRHQAARIGRTSSSDPDALMTLEEEDFRHQVADPSAAAMSMLDSAVGMERVKDFVRGIAAQVRVDSMRRERGLSAARPRSLHMVFKGSPGTGKTTFARIIAQLLKELRVLKIGHLVEVSRADLVGEFIGQTAPRTQGRIREALGGVLFVDEAYSLLQDERDSYGKEAIDTLVKGMEDHRDSLVVILAGYSAEMEALLSRNEGLRSRFPNVIEFPDYSAEELVEIGRGMLAARDLRATDTALVRFSELCRHIARDPVAGNARAVRNLVDRLERRQSRRLEAIGIPTSEQLQLIEAVDVPDCLGA